MKPEPVPEPVPEPAKEAGRRSASTQEHRAQAIEEVACAVLTVSDTRTMEDDRGGALLAELAQANGHQVVERAIVPDDIEAIRKWALQVLASGSAEVLLVTGGSGISPRDVSPEALRPLLSKELPGFGEVFRMLSWEEVGAATMLSRAFAGVLEHVLEHLEHVETGSGTRRALLFVLPGSTNAVRLAMTQLILPELGHLVREMRGREMRGREMRGREMRGREARVISDSKPSKIP